MGRYQFTVGRLLAAVVGFALLFGGLSAWKTYQRAWLAFRFRESARSFRIEANKVRKGAPEKAKEFEDMAYSFEYAAEHGKIPVLDRQTGKWTP